MATVRKQKAKGLPKRAGKRKNAGYYQRYHARLIEKKLRRVLRCNGYEAAHRWADARLILSLLRKIVDG